MQSVFTPKQARSQLDIAIGWGRYAELFDYDANTGRLTLAPDAPKNLPPD